MIDLPIAKQILIKIKLYKSLHISFGLCKIQLFGQHQNILNLYQHIYMDIFCNLQE